VVQKRLLAAPYNPYEVFLTAEAFRASSRLLIAHVPPGAPLGYEYVINTNLAFCLELYLKCLLLIEKRPAGRHHKLKKHFEELEQNHQDAIRKEYEKILKTDPLILAEFSTLKQNGEDPDKIWDFDAVLSDNSEAFERSRYPFDPDHKIQGYRAVPIEIATRKVIVSIHRSWQNAFNNLVARELLRSTSQVQ
jgi:hypothetical protein